jgi:hypothetical protein
MRASLEPPAADEWFDPALARRAARLAGAQFVDLRATV